MFSAQLPKNIEPTQSANPIVLFLFFTLFFSAVSSLLSSGNGEILNKIAAASGKVPKNKTKYNWDTNEEGYKVCPMGRVFSVFEKNQYQTKNPPS